MNWKDNLPKENRYYETENGILYCGDCLKIMEQFPEKSIDLVLTDIPYNEVDKKTNGIRVFDKGNANVFNGDVDVLLEKIDFLQKGTSIMFCGYEQFGQICKFWRNKKGTLRPIIWEKTNPSPVNCKYVYLNAVELTVWFRKPKSVFNPFYKKNIFKYPNGKSKQHPTEKNLNLFFELLEDNSKENDLILDPFLGSGTTAVACEQLNRKWIGIEIEEKYCEIAKQRIGDELLT